MLRPHAEEHAHLHLLVKAVPGQVLNSVACGGGGAVLDKKPITRRQGARAAAQSIEVEGGGGEGRVISAAQIRRARELLGWTPYRLAPRAGMVHTLLRQFEAGARTLEADSVARLRAALEEAGVEFLVNGSVDGVRLQAHNGSSVEVANDVKLKASRKRAK